MVDKGPGYNPDGTPIWSAYTLRQLLTTAALLGYCDDVRFYARLLTEQYGYTP